VLPSSVFYRTSLMLVMRSLLLSRIYLAAIDKVFGSMTALVPSSTKLIVSGSLPASFFGLAFSVLF